MLLERHLKKIVHFTSKYGEARPSHLNSEAQNMAGSDFIYHSKRKKTLQRKKLGKLNFVKDSKTGEVRLEEK